MTKKEKEYASMHRSKALPELTSAILNISGLAWGHRNEALKENNVIDAIIKCKKLSPDMICPSFNHIAIYLN